MRVKTSHTVRLVILCVVSLAIFTGCKWITSSSDPEPPRGAEPYWPTERWRTAAPEQQGMDSEILASMFARIQTRGYGIDSVTIVRNGHIVADAAIYPYRLGSMHAIHSCTKSIVSALVGIAIAERYIEDVEQPITGFFPARSVANLDSRREPLTLKHLLTMTTGLDCRDSYLYRWEGLERMQASEDWVQYVLDLPMGEPPGSKFEYCNGASFLLSAIIQQTTGVSALEFAEEHLFGPLGISGFDWPANPRGIQIGWGDIRMTPHDMARFGYLYLRKGEWEGKQVVPADWVEESTRKQTAATLLDGYGYQWWVDEPGDPAIHTALGYAGQFIIVVPARDLVVVFTSDLAERDTLVPLSLLREFIIPAIGSTRPLPENRGGVAALEARIQDLATR